MIQGERRQGERACRNGTIGMSGRLEILPAYIALTPADLWTGMPPPWQLRVRFDWYLACVRYGLLSGQCRVVPGLRGRNRVRSGHAA